MLRDFLFVGIGGAVGSMARYGISTAVSKYWMKPLPLGTLLVNLVGCLVIGLLAGLALRNEWLHQTGGWLLLATGLCGGFTTFSAFALENVKLLEGNNTATAILYLSLSVVGGLLLCRVGMLLSN